MKLELTLEVCMTELARYVRLTKSGRRRYGLLSFAGLLFVWFALLVLHPRCLSHQNKKSKDIMAYESSTPNDQNLQFGAEQAGVLWV